MAKYKCPYTYPHRSRKAMVDYLCGIGGYSRYGDGSWPIEFNVAAWDTDFSFDHLWEKYAPEFLSKEQMADPAVEALVRKLLDENESHLWVWGQDDAYRSLHGDDTYKTLWDGTPCDAKLELHGRGGKHLVIAAFDGTDMSRCSSDDLADMLATESENSYGWCWSYAEVRKFYKYCRQCEIDFTPITASAEVEYLGAFCFFANIVEPEVEDLKVAPLPVAA